MRKIIFFFIFGVSILAAPSVSAEQVDVYPVRLHLFYLNTCPHCHEEIKFLDSLKEKYPHLEVSKYEVSQDIKNRSLFGNVMKRYQLQGSVPVTIIGDNKPIVGFDKPSGIGKELEKAIQECSVKACQGFVDEATGKSKLEEGSRIKVDMDSRLLKMSTDKQTSDGKEITVRIFGKERQFDSESSIYGLGVVLGLADGINPCMFSVILFLLTYLLAIGSRQRAIKAGIAFVITTFLVYFLFMFGIIKVVQLFGLFGLMRQAVIVFALVAGVIMIKDFFFYGKGISLEIPERFKPQIEGLVKKGTLPSAIILAILSSLVELPCTSGLPLAYVTIIANNQLNPIGYLLWYNLFFVLPLVVIVAGVMLAWTKVEKVEAWKEKFKKYMRLVSGLLLLFLAYALWRNLI